MFNDSSIDALRRRMSHLEEVAQTGCWELDVEQARSTYSPGFLRLFDVTGLDPGPRYDPVLARVPVEDRELLRSAIDRAVADGSTYAVEHRVVLADGGVRWLQTRGRVDRDERGTAVGVFTTCTDVTEARHVLEMLARSTLEDPLTGLVTRFLIEDRLAQALRRGRSAEPSTSVLFIDIDDFTALNQRLGYRAGDEILTALAHRLQRHVRTGDTVGRYGGDEFVVVCEEIGDPASALRLAERLRERLHLTSLASDAADLSVSIGVAVAMAGEPPHSVIGRGGIAATAAARRGPGQIVLAE